MMILSKVKKVLSNPYLCFAYLNTKGILKWIPDRLVISWKYQKHLKKKLNVDNPKTFNEKLQWLKLYDRRPEYTQMVDKYEVRKYIEERVGGEYLVPVLGIWDSFDDIDFGVLPKEFVLKCTHDSGGLVICRDKNELDIMMAKRKIEKSLKRNYYYHSREWPYKNVRPRIIAEEYLADETQNGLTDYKIHNFNGVPKIILVCSERFSETELKEDFYNVNWDHLDLSRPNVMNSSKPIDRPAELERMLYISRRLSEGIPFLRTDFYFVNGKVYIGELTFFPAAGFNSFNPESFDMTMGEWLTLPNKKS